MHRVVVAALLRAPAEVLLCYRSPARRWYPAVWDFPGGHVEPDETPLEALTRELIEELGVVVSVGALPVAPDFVVQDGDLDMSMWVVHAWEGQPANRAPHEHERVGWFKIEDATAMALARPEYRQWLAAAAAVAVGRHTS